MGLLGYILNLGASLSQNLIQGILMLNVIVDANDVMIVIVETIYCKKRINVRWII